MGAYRVASAVAAGCALLAFSGSVAAQVTISDRRDLEFGTIRPSVATRVAPTDSPGRGWFRVHAVGSFIAQFTLPVALVGPTGASVPLSFGSADGLMRLQGTQVFFDPRQPLPFASGGSGRNRNFYLGGTVGPGPSVPVGTYTAVITLTIIQAGA